MHTKFWLVWNPSGGNPLARHQQRVDAIAEATRLARNHPSQSFYVVEATHHARKTDVEVSELIESDESPW